MRVWAALLFIGCQSSADGADSAEDAGCTDECACNVPIREFTAWNTELEDGFVGQMFTGLSTGVYDIYSCPSEEITENCADPAVLCHDAVNRITSFSGPEPFLRLEQRYIDEGDCTPQYLRQIDVSCAELSADPAGYALPGLATAEAWMVEQVDADNRTCRSSQYNAQFVRVGDRIIPDNCGGDTIMYRFTLIDDRQIAAQEDATQE